MINIILLIFLVFILMLNNETFVALSPEYFKMLEYTKLQKEITSKNDNFNTKVKNGKTLFR